MKRTVNAAGGAVSQTALTPYELCGGDAPQPATCLPDQSNARQPHTTPSARSAASGVQFTFDERFQGALLIADIAFASAPR